MKTAEYYLKSNPEKSVKVPADYASKAESIVELAVKNSLDLISKLMSSRAAQLAL